MNRALATLPDFSSATDFSASAAKAKLGEVIDLVAAGGLATITRRGRQRFAVLKLETVEALVAAAKEQELESLGNRYDELVARMQSPEGQSAVDALFAASGGEIGSAVMTAASDERTGAAATSKRFVKRIAKTVERHAAGGSVAAAGAPKAAATGSPSKSKKAAR